MIIRIKRKILEQGIIGLLTLFTITSILIGVSFTTNYVIGATNITNSTVLARVNITNTEPNITMIVVSPSPIDLTANGVTVVVCNASIFEYNGINDINQNATNATFYIQSVGENVPADNNHRYSNSSCNDCVQNSATNISCACRFGLQYYANDSSTWLCNMTVRDKGGTQKSGSEINLSDSDVSSAVTVTKLLAINTSTLLDYGNLSVTETSAEIVHNITNVGNINLNLSLRGYGGTNDSVDSPFNNMTMTCELGNISIGNQRYEVGSQFTGATVFANMQSLTNTTRRINFTVPSRIDDSAFGWDRNSTLWRLQIPLTVGGLCNGTIIFGAVDAET